MMDSPELTPEQVQQVDEQHDAYLDDLARKSARLYNGMVAHGIDSRSAGELTAVWLEDYMLPVSDDGA